LGGGDTGEGILFGNVRGKMGNVFLLRGINSVVFQIFFDTIFFFFFFWFNSCFRFHIRTLFVSLEYLLMGD